MNESFLVGLFMGATAVSIAGIVMMLMRLESKIDAICAELIDQRSQQAAAVEIDTPDADIWGK